MKGFLTAIVSLTGCVSVAVVASVSTSATAQDGACFMVNSSGKTINLNSLCGSSTSPQINKDIFIAKIKRREHNIPVIDVTFNNGQTFEMIVDTGASGTVITRPMAQALGVVPVKMVRVDTASGVGLAFPVGYVQSIAVDGAVVNKVPVAIAGPEQDIGLLGHDFFGNYDLTVKRDVVEFRRRSP